MSHEEPTSATTRNRGVAILPRPATFLDARGRRCPDTSTTSSPAW
jgi:hypothetical protein